MSDTTAVAGLETVIVTARKRAEDAQTVPIAITALNQNDLDQLHIETIQDLSSIAPSVNVEPSTFRQDTINITIRGQRNFDSSSQGGNPGLSFDTASAVYLDGVYYARAFGLTGALYDMSSVDVLKGPQGTLVGRNTTGGAILLQTNEPTDQFGGYVKALAGDYDQYGLQGAVNIPLSDDLFFRGAFSALGNKGYIRNFYTDPATGYSNTQPAEGTQKLAGRFSLKWLPDDTFSLLVRADLSEEHDTGSTYHNLGYFVGTTPATGNKPSICNIPGTCTGFTDFLGHHIAPYFISVNPNSTGVINTSPLAYNALINSVNRQQAYGFWSTEQTLSNADVGHYHTVSATADKLFGDVDVKLLGAYRWFDSFGSSNSRGLPYDTTNFSYGFPRYQSWQSELTVNGNGFDNRLKWTTGLFFFQESSPDDGGSEYLFLPSAGSPAPAAGKQITVTDWSNNGERNTSYAAYAQGTYSITSDTRLTAGVRFSLDQRSAFMDTTTIRTPATAATTKPVINGTFDPAGFTYLGTTYSGQTIVCGLTNAGGIPLPMQQCPTTINKSFSKPTWTVAVDHDLFDKTIVYFTSRSGYRSGGINTQAANPAVAVGLPENVLDFEAGIKSDWELWGMPLRTNFDGYNTQYKDIQIAVTMPNVVLATGPGGVGPCTQALFNAGQCLGTQNSAVTLNGKSARVWGAEWDITAIPIPQLTLDWTGSYLDARYTNFVFVPPPGYLEPTGTNNLTGTPFPLPAWQTSAVATYYFGLHELGELPVGDLMFSAHYFWQSRYLAELQNYNPSQRTSPYGLLNLQLTLVDLGRSNSDLSLFVNNATNQKACGPEYVGVLNSAPNATFGVAGTSGVLQCVPLAPRMAGIQAIYRF
ncbi:MAG TPA: TonB-dependent receptor [Rhizomicrobium sp.]|nr:TonB-dependent receptor [Rhizomicrobium sp.]